MAYFYLSLGSNIRPYHNLVAALDALSDQFESLTTSSVYESTAVGFCGNNFLNLVVGLSSKRRLIDISCYLKSLENSLERDRSASRFSSRTIDVDILVMDNRVTREDGIDLPRPEILTNAFVLLPLAEIAPDTIHPVTGKTYAYHWREFNIGDQKLWPVDFFWGEGNISSNATKELRST